MKVLVIGGNLFFGFELVNQLIAKGFDVHVMNRGNQNPVYLGVITHHICDRDNLDELKKIAEQSWDIVFDQFCMNEFHAKNVVELFTGYCKRYVMTSSQSVYDEGSGLKESDFIGENYTFCDETLKLQNYTENKRRADSIILGAKDLNPIVVRPPIVQGERDHTKRLTWHISRILKGEEIYLPSMTAKISFVEARDLAQNIIHLATSKVNGPVNICSQEPLAIGELISMIEEITNKKLVRAKNKNESNASPYGIEEDWWMDTSRLKSLEGYCREIDEWLPKLIKSNLKLIESDTPETTGF